VTKRLEPELFDLVPSLVLGVLEPQQLDDMRTLYGPRLPVMAWITPETWAWVQAEGLDDGDVWDIAGAGWWSTPQLARRLADARARGWTPRAVRAAAAAAIEGVA
jgi:hypothetical protein